MQKRNGALVDNLRPDLVDRFNPATAWGNIQSVYTGLSGLRGYWPMTARSETEAVLDASFAGRTLTNNGSTPFGIAGLRVFADLNGTSHYLSRADEAGLEMAGGLTFGCWVYLDEVPGEAGINFGLIGKWTETGNQRAYLLRITLGGVPQCLISSNGTLTTTVSGDALSPSQWYFIAGRYRPSTELAIFVNRVKTVNTTSIPASIFSTGTAVLNVGAYNAGANFLPGDITHVFLCGSALYDSVGTEDAMINALFDLSRPLFAVRG